MQKMVRISCNLLVLMYSLYALEFGHCTDNQTTTGTSTETLATGALIESTTTGTPTGLPPAQSSLNSGYVPIQFNKTALTSQTNDNTSNSSLVRDSANPDYEYVAKDIHEYKPDTATTSSVNIEKEIKFRDYIPLPINPCNPESIITQLKEHNLRPPDDKTIQKMRACQEQYDRNIELILDMYDKEIRQYKESCENNSSAKKKKKEKNLKPELKKESILEAVKAQQKLINSIKEYSTILESNTVSVDAFNPINVLYLQLTAYKHFCETIRNKISETYEKGTYATLEKALQANSDFCDKLPPPPYAELRGNLLEVYKELTNIITGKNVAESIPKESNELLEKAKLTCESCQKALATSTSMLELLEKTNDIVNAYNGIASIAKKECKIKVNNTATYFALGKYLGIISLHYYWLMYQIAVIYIGKYQTALDSDIQNYKNAMSKDKYKDKQTAEQQELVIHRKQTTIVAIKEITRAIKSCIEYLEKVIKEMQKATDMKGVINALISSAVPKNSKFIISNAVSEKKNGPKVDCNNDQQLKTLLPPCICIHSLKALWDNLP